jgi:hypothetical protein
MRNVRIQNQCVFLYIFYCPAQLLLFTNSYNFNRSGVVSTEQCPWCHVLSVSFSWWP